MDGEESEQPVTASPAVDDASEPSANEGGGLVALVKDLLSHDAHPLVQFIKYGLAGGISTAVFAGCFAVLTATVLPVEADSKLNYSIASLIAFFPSNLVCYLINIRWVFKPGRHSRMREIMMFLGASGFAFMIGTPLGQFLVIRYDLVGMLRYIALAVAIVCSVMVNFVCRKFFIFKG